MKEISAKDPADRGATLLRKNYHPWNDWKRRRVEKKVKKKKKKKDWGEKK